MCGRRPPGTRRLTLRLGTPGRTRSRSPPRTIGWSSPWSRPPPLPPRPTPGRRPCRSLMRGPRPRQLGPHPGGPHRRADLGRATATVDAADPEPIAATAVLPPAADIPSVEFVGYPDAPSACCRAATRHAAAPTADGAPAIAAPATTFMSPSGSIADIGRRPPMVARARSPAPRDGGRRDRDRRPDAATVQAVAPGSRRPTASPRRIRRPRPVSPRRPPAPTSGTS